MFGTTIVKMVRSRERDSEKVRRSLYKRFRAIGDARTQGGKRVIYCAPEGESYTLEECDGSTLRALEGRYLCCMDGYVQVGAS